MRKYLVVFLFILSLSALMLAQQGKGNECTPAGVWYGGSVVAYQMTIIAAGPAGHYIITAEGMYKNSVMNTFYSGDITKKGNAYEGSMMQLATQDPDFLNPPPIGKMPDIYAGYSSMVMLDCNTIKNTIPFFGIYFAQNIWQPGVAWVPGGKVPLRDAPDVDLINVLGGGHPIIETYHRLQTTLNPDLAHQ